MSDVYLTVDDRRFLRAVLGGHIVRSADGRIMQRGGHRNARREKSLKKAREAGWVHADPDPTGVYRLTVHGEQVLAAREPAVEYGSTR